MFYIPLVALLLYGVRLAVVIAVLTPVINFLVTGNPNWQSMTVLTLELALFTFFAHWLLGKKTKWIAAPLGYVLAKCVSSIFVGGFGILEVSTFDFLLSSVSNGALGIMVLLLINVLLLRYREK
jgi:hypothetical protein